MSVMTVSGASNLIDDDLLQLRASAADSRHAIFSSARVIVIIARRDLHLQTLQPDLGDVPGLLHEIAQRAANLELVDRDERRHVRSPLWRMTTPAAADATRAETRGPRAFDRDLALELVGEQRDDPAP